MPTGYTAGVADGSITEFSDFAMQCARAFGALISLRDAPSGTPIPDEFKPSPYHDEQLAAAKARQCELTLMTPEQVEIAAEAAFEVATVRKQERDAANEEQRRRYLAMRAHVEAWKAPSRDHEGLRTFMLEQLTQSIDFDCSSEPSKALVKPSSQEWLARQIEINDSDLVYHSRQAAEEVRRCVERTKWVCQLRASLPKHAQTQPQASA